VRACCAARARVNVSVFYQPAPTGFALLATQAATGGETRSSNAWARSIPEAVQGHRLALEGAATVLPLSNRKRQMDLKERNLALFAALSLFCAGFAWTVDHAIFSAVFLVLGAAAIIEVAERYWR
jgi:hypothetical protein